MPRTCTVCTHEQRPEIDRALLDGEPYRTIAKRYGASPSAVLRHREHLSNQLVKAREAEEVAQADNLLEQVRALQSRALGILDRADEAGDLRTALSAIREARGNLELLAKLLGELQPEGTTINVYSTPEWLSLRAVVISALHPYPEAARAVSKALTEGRP